MQIFVLGMHRSGTSALARTLGLLGCHAGDSGDFPAADGANPRGYWERRDVWRLDEDLLSELGATWDGVTSVDPERFVAALPPADLARVEGRARDIVTGLDAAAAGRPWVIKDPRLCLLFPLWRRVALAPVCVLVERSPYSVARSLSARDDSSLAFGIALWEHYQRSALTVSAGLPRLRVRYEDLVDRPRETARWLRQELERIAAEAGEPAGAFVEPPTGALEAFLDPSLERHPRAPEIERELLTPPQRALLDALRDDPLPDHGGELSTGARDLLERHGAYSRDRDLRRVELEGLYALVAETSRNAATAIASEREARERAEATAVAAAEQARALQNKIAQDSSSFEMEHAERLRLEAVLAAAGIKS